jgi:hypothetical protein
LRLPTSGGMSVRSHGATLILGVGVGWALGLGCSERLEQRRLAVEERRRSRYQTCQMCLCTSALIALAAAVLAATPSARSTLRK